MMNGRWMKTNGVSVVDYQVVVNSI
jgi:hypothetical protein